MYELEFYNYNCCDECDYYELVLRLWRDDVLLWAHSYYQDESQEEMTNDLKEAAKPYGVEFDFDGSPYDWKVIHDKA